MKPVHARILADAFLKGFFGVFDAMLSRSFQYSAEEPSTHGEREIVGDLRERPVQLSCVLPQGLGQVSILLTVPDALRVLAALSGPTEDPEALSPADKGTLREIAEPALGGGIAALMERCERGSIQPDGINVDDNGEAAASALSGAFGGTAITAAFTYDGGGGLTGRALLLFSGGMDALVPDHTAEQFAEINLTRPTLSPDELNDILGSFPGAAIAPPPPPAAAAAPAPAARHFISAGDRENLDLVLDIRLLATARLGRIEMPLGDILNLGPGSILEIGHLVDEPIELLINDKLIARGDVVVVDEKFGLRITEIVSQQDRIESLR